MINGPHDKRRLIYIKQTFGGSMKMKKTNVLWCLAALLLCSGLLLSCNRQKTGTVETEKKFLYRVGYINYADRDAVVYPAMLRFIERMESEELLQRVGVDKIEVLTADSDLNIERQTSNVETILTRGVDILFLIGVDTEGNTTAVEMCNAAGVPVFMVGTEATGGEWKFIGFNEVAVGKKQGEWCAANLPQNTKIFYLQGTPGREATLQLEQGFRDGISSRKDLEIVSAQTGNFEVARAMQVTEDWIQAYRNSIGAIVSCDAHMMSGAIEALTGANMIDSVITCGVLSVGTWDAEYIRSGVQDYATLKYWPGIGTICADIAAEYYQGNNIPESTLSDLYDVTPENYGQYVEAFNLLN
jgi:ABC-type sugar transport system substrate-binding protein